MNRRATALLAAVCALAAFGVVLAGSSERRLGAAQAPQQAQLVRLVEAERSQVGTLQSAVTRLRTELAGAEASRARSSSLGQQEAATLARLTAAAGESAVSGPGLVVTLSDASSIPAGTTDTDAYRIHDTDLQLVVNALFAAGARAVAVNGNRVGALTSIRSAGQTVVVDLTPLVPPYRVSALGAAVGPFRRSVIARHFSAWETEFGLGFDVSETGRLSVPAFVELAPLAAASPAPRATAKPAGRG